jgi:hypothetical protein
MAGIEPKENKLNNILSILSACGSIASLAALCIVLIDKSSNDPQLTVWRIALVFICLVIIGAAIVVAYDRISKISNNQRYSLSEKAAKIASVIAISLIFIAIFMDGVFATINWDCWCLGRIFKYFFPIF